MMCQFTECFLNISLSSVWVNWKKSRGGPVGSRTYRGMPIQMPAMQMPIQMPMPMVSYPQVIDEKLKVMAILT